MSSVFYIFSGKVFLSSATKAQISRNSLLEKHLRSCPDLLINASYGYASPEPTP
jgi:hypothetical protein